MRAGNRRNRCHSSNACFTHTHTHTHSHRCWLKRGFSLLRSQEKSFPHTNSLTLYRTRLNKTKSLDDFCSKLVSLIVKKVVFKGTFTPASYGPDFRTFGLFSLIRTKIAGVKPPLVHDPDHKAKFWSDKKRWSRSGSN